MFKRLIALVPKPSATDIPALDGLRGFAMLMVLMVHSMYELNRDKTDPIVTNVLGHTSAIYGVGGTGVDLFFVLSGFLLFLPYAASMLGERDFPDTRKFYVRRMLRILPAYWISIIVILTFFNRKLLSASGAKIIFTHIFLVQNGLPGAREAINGVFWTMAVEAQFYLVLPLIAWCLYRSSKSGRPLVTASIFLCLFVISPVHSVVGILVKHKLPGLFPYYGATELIGFLTTFTAGIAASLFYTSILHKRMELTPDSVRTLSKWAGAIGVCMIVIHQFLVYVGRDLSRLDYFFFHLYTGIAYAGILLGTLLGWPSWRRVQSTWLMRFLGLISYSVYIWHYRIYQFLAIPLSEKYCSGIGVFVSVIVLTFVLVFPIGLVSFLIAEKPFFTKRRALR